MDELKGTGSDLGCSMAEDFWRGEEYAHKICTRCKLLGRICTWTRAIESCALNDPRVLAFKPEPVVEIGVIDIPVPGWAQE